jgi:DNA-binding SARP family transcriptional activator
VGTAPPLTFEILGPLSIRRGDRMLTLRSGHQRKALAALLINDRALLADELIDILWGERPPATALGTLQTHISRLRATLGGQPDLLPSDATGYRLHIDETQVDARRFEQLVDRGNRVAAVDGYEARRVLADGLALWRGPALIDFRYEPFAQAEITRLEGLRLAALVQHISVGIDIGLHAEACSELEILVQDHPLHEELHALLMVALYRCGRQVDALAVYERLRGTLRDELGLEPTPELRALELDVLNQSATLSAPVHGGGVARVDDAVPRTLELRGWIEELDTPPLDDKMACELLLARGNGQRRGGREQDARQTFAAAVRLASTSGSSSQLADGALGLAGPPEDTMVGEHLDEALLERAVRALPENRPVVTMLRARLAVALIDRGDVDRGNQMADAAVAFARSVGDPASLSYALRARHRTWFDPAALAERLALGTELVKLGMQLDDREVLAWGHRWRAIDLLETGDLAAFEAAIDSLEDLATELHDAFHWWGVTIRRAGLALLTGPPDKAEALVMEGLGLAEQIHSPYTIAASLNAFWALRWRQGRLDELRETILHVEEELSPAYAFLVPFLYRVLDEPDEAARSYEVLARDGFAELLERDTIQAGRLFCLAAITEVTCYLHDVDHARQLYAWLSPYAGRLAVIHPGITAVAPIDQLLGQLSALLGDSPRSTAHFEAALARCREIGAPTLEASAQDAYTRARREFEAGVPTRP